MISFRKAQAAFEKRFLTGAVKQHDGHVWNTAIALDMDRSYLHKLIRKYKIKVPKLRNKTKEKK